MSDAPNDLWYKNEKADCQGPEPCDKRGYPYPLSDLALELGMTVDTIYQACKGEIHPWPCVNSALVVWDSAAEALIRYVLRCNPERFVAAWSIHGIGSRLTSEKQPETVDPTMKDTNPKDAVGVRKAPLSCLPTPVLFEVGVGMLEGARKYGRHNWRAIGVRSSVYYDAAMRHLAQWWEGEDIDADSGIHHVSKAIACLMVLRDAQIRKMCEDDRPPSSGDWLGELNKAAGAVIDKYPDAKAPYTKE